MSELFISALGCGENIATKLVGTPDGNNGFIRLAVETPAGTLRSSSDCTFKFRAGVRIVRQAGLRLIQDRRKLNIVLFLSLFPVKIRFELRFY
jgi:hypothetical protein